MANKIFLLCCKQINGRHTGDSISLESESVTEEYGITTKVFKVITDNASNMIKAFGPMIHELTIVNDDDDDEDKSEETNEYSSSSEDDDTDENDNSGDEDEDSTFVTNAFDSIPVHHGDRLSCFAHTLQLVVKDGLNNSKQMSSLLNKLSKLINHIKKSTIAMERVEKQNKKGVIPKNDILNLKW